MKKTSVVIAFDFGLRRIGCAIGQNLTNTANPLGTISNSSSGIDWNKIEQWIEEWQPDKFIIGKTKKADGSKSDLDDAIITHNLIYLISNLKIIKHLRVVYVLDKLVYCLPFQL